MSMNEYQVSRARNTTKLKKKSNTKSRVTTCALGGREKPKGAEEEERRGKSTHTRADTRMYATRTHARTISNIVVSFIHVPGRDGEGGPEGAANENRTWVWCKSCSPTRARKEKRREASADTGGVISQM